MSNKTVEIIVNRFPDKKKLINRLYKKSEEFREICYNYKEIIDTWSNNQNLAMNPDIKEYKILLKDLESDIELFLLEKSGNTQRV